jgi:hypothetical protein
MRVWEPSAENGPPQRAIVRALPLASLGRTLGGDNYPDGHATITLAGRSG